MAGLPLQQLLILLLPALGAIAKRVPFVANKVIPIILAVVAAGINYWTLAGLPMSVPVVEPVDPGTVGALVEVVTYAMASFWDSLASIGKLGVALGGGVIQSYIAARYHKSYKRQKDGTSARWA